MRVDLSKHMPGKLILLAWASLCITVFIIYPGRRSFIYSSNLDEWSRLAEKIERLSPVRDLLSLAGALAWVAVFSIACTSLGSFIVKLGRIEGISNPSTSVSGLAATATRFLIGQAIFSFIFLILAGLYQLIPTYVILLLLTGFLLGASDTISTIPKIIRGTGIILRRMFENRVERVMGLLSMGTLLLSLLHTTSRLSFDSSAIYFSDARVTALTRYIQYFTDDSFVASVFQTAIQYAALIQLFGDQAARMFSWICGLTMIIFSLALAERVGISRQAKCILLTLLLTATAFFDLMGDGKVDLTSSALAIAALYWITVESQSKTPVKSQLLLIGFLIGLAILNRPFNAFTLGIWVILFYLQRAVREAGCAPLRYKFFRSSLFHMSIGMTVPGIYYLFTNWMILGSPLAFLSTMLKADPASGPWNYNPNQILAVRLLYPLIVTFYNSPHTLGNISPLFVAFLPAFFVQDIREQLKLSKQLYVLLGISLITLLIWIFSFFTVYEIRYVLFLWAILFIPVAEIIAATLKNRDPLLQSVPVVLMIALLTFSMIRTLYIALDSYAPVDEQGNPQCFCESLDSINRYASLGDRVLTLHAFRYYLRSDLFVCSTKHDEYRELGNAAEKGDDAFWLEVYKQGYKYIAYETEYTTRHLHMAIVPGPDNTPEWLGLEPIYGKPGDSHVTYRIVIKNPPAKATATCELSSTGIWDVYPGE